MKFFDVLTAAVLAGLVVAAPQKSAALDVKLASAGHTKIKATITNTGGKDLRLLNVGTVLDHGPVQKLSVKSSNGSLPFFGIKKRVQTHGLSDKVFTPLAAGASITVSLDASHAHDLDAGSTYTVTSSGRIPYALPGSNALVGNVGFRSNALGINLPHTATLKRASDARRSERDGRKVGSVIQDCSDADYQAAVEANQQCANLANAAADRAASDDGKFQEYFATLDGGVRQTVIDRLHAVANECSRAPADGSTTTHCTDTASQCTDGVLAYTYPDTGYVVDCPLYFNVLPLLEGGCHRQDRATTTIHEYTHSNTVYAPGTDDLGYGFNAIMQLDSNSRVNNADTYAMFANAVYVNC